MIKLKNKKRAGRIAAFLFAAVLIVYPLTDVVTAGTNTAGAVSSASAVKKDSNTELLPGKDDIKEQPEKDDSSSTPYEELSENARAGAAAVNMPLAGYEVDEKLADADDPSVRRQTVYSGVFSSPELNRAVFGLSTSQENDDTERSKKTTDAQEKQTNLKKSSALMKKSASHSSGLRQTNTSMTDEQWEELVSLGHDTDSKINNFNAAYSTEILEGSDTVYSIYRSENFGIKYTVTLNTGKEIDVGNAVITLPSELFKDRNGNPVTIRDADGIALPRYSENPQPNTEESPLYVVRPDSIVKSNRTQFGYYIDHDSEGKEIYVIVNYEKIKPGTNWFEVVYDEINVFDVPDAVSDGTITGNEDSWTIQPEIDVQYKYGNERWVFRGSIANDPVQASLQPISLRWDEYLSDDLDYSGSTLCFTDPFEEGQYLYAKEDMNDVCLYYCSKDSEGHEIQKYKFDYINGEFYRKDNDEWIQIPLETDEDYDNYLPHNAVDIAEVYERNGELFYYICDSYNANESQSGETITLNTYFDHNGDPVYQVRISNGVTTYYRVNADKTAWVQEPSVRNLLPQPKWDYLSFHEDAHELSGIVDTNVRLDKAEKKVGQVTSNISGDLNTESQVLSFIPQEQRDYANIDTDNNVYVLWEVDISGKNCTQPFDLYMEEALSYYNRQPAYEDGTPLTYTYYDSQTGMICDHVSDDNTDRQNGGRIVGVTGLPWDGTFRDHTTYDNVPSGGNTLWYLGSSDPSRSSEKQSEGLNKVRTTGSYDKKVYVVAEYPKGAFPQQGVTADQQNGVCIDTLEEAADGSLVYIPYGAVLRGKNDNYNLGQLLKQELGDDYDETKGNLVDRSVVQDIIRVILDSELETSEESEISPLMVDFIDELTENLPKTVELKSVLENMTTEEVRAFILNSWKDPGDDADKKQIQMACNDYMNGILDEHLDRIKVNLENGDQVSLKSYNAKKIYREVKNDVNIIIKPLDEEDSTIARAAAASHHRIEREPNVKNEFTLSKQARGGKKGWIDMYDSSDTDLFDSTFSFQVNSSATVFNETHPKSYAYFYDNSSYVNLVTADDILTAEPIGVCAGGSSLYGGSCILGPEDYCYTNAKIVVNERVYNIVEDTSTYGASEISQDALIDNSGSPVDRDWHIYVSYEVDSNGNTVWVPYRTISMQDYLNDTNYSNENSGSNVLFLEFMQDERQPFRIKVEHNTIDYQSSVKMQITAAVKKESPALKSGLPLRSYLYEKDDPDNIAFDDQAAKVDSFTLRLHNYAGFLVQKNNLADDGQGNIISTKEKVLTNETPKRYDLVNRQASAENTLIPDNMKLTDENFVSAEAFSAQGEESTVKRVHDYVDLSRLERKSVAEKTSTLSNDLTHGRAHLTYRIAGFEGYQIDNAYKENIDIIKGNSSYTEPGTGRKKIYIYDFLPPGVEFEGYSGSNEMPVAGFLTSNTDISDESNWITTDEQGNKLIGVSVDIVSESDPAWASWGGKTNGRYLVRFTLTLPENPEDYTVVGGGDWFFGCGVRFTANVSWERYSTAKSVPNLALYVTDSETLGRQNTQVFMDNGNPVPRVNEKDIEDIYSPFRNTVNDPYLSNLDCDDTTPDTTYNRMYAKSMDLGDIARSSSTTVGKQVRANADTFALYSDRTCVIKGDEYTYNINVENQTSGAVSGLILYDIIENASDSPTSWKGIFRAADTSMLSLNGIKPKVYYHNSTAVSVPKTALAPSGSTSLPTQEQWLEKGWQPASLWNDSGEVPYQLSDVRAVAIALYESDGVTPYVMVGRQTLSYQILMKAPTDVDITNKKFAINRSNYCYYKVVADNDDQTQWITDETDKQYYNELGNRTVVTLGDRRLLKVAKYVEKKYSNVDEIGDTDFTFRVTRRIGYYEGDSFVQGDVPCANIRYRIYHCTFDQNHYIDKLLEEIDPGIIHTTNENGELVLHDGECAVFRYLPSTPLSAEDHSEEYDIDNYKITELSKPYWYEYKTSGQHSSEGWFYGDGPNEMHYADPQPENPYDTNSPVQYYKDRCIIVTNTYRPVIYISKNISGVPADMPTNPKGLNADQTKTREQAFKTFDYTLELYEYPMNRITGEYFGNDEGYSDRLDTNHDGQITLSSGQIARAAWLKFREYYDNIGNTLSYIAGKISQLETQIAGLDSETQAAEQREKQVEKTAWENLKKAIEEDKVLLDRHIEIAGGMNRFFAPPKTENADYNWVGNGYLLWSVSNRLILPISGYEEDPRDPTYKCFSNKVSDRAQTDRKNGAYLYEYIVGNHTDIYSIPEGWVFWEMNDQENRKEIAVAGNASTPIRFSVMADQVIALPLFISGGMMISNSGFHADENGLPEYGGENIYLPKYCYRVREDMDNKYWDDIAGEYKTVPVIEGTNKPDLNERSWNVKTPAGNKPYRNMLGVLDENIAVYENSFRFKDIYMQKTVEPSAHVPKGERKNSVDTTAFLYRVTRKLSSESDPQIIPPQKCRQMTWELWTCDSSGKLLQNKMTGPVTRDGYVLAPIGNYDGAQTHYTIKIRHVEAGYTYYIDEILNSRTILGENNTPADEEAFFEQHVPYADYSQGYFSYRYYQDGEEYNNAEDKVYYCDDSMNRLQQYLLATDEIYTDDTNETTGTVQTEDSATIKENISKVEMEIQNVYMLRNLTVTKSVIARETNDNMQFTIRIRRQDGNDFSPTAVNFYRMESGRKIPLTESELNELQGENHTPALAHTADYAYMDFKLKNGIYAEFVDVGRENDVYQICEKDWSEEQSSYIHLDPVDAPGEWSAWKNAVLGDNTLSVIRNGDEGYMIISKEYISDRSGDYDEIARDYLESGSHPVYLKFELRTKNSGNAFVSPENIFNDIAFVNGVSINDLSSIPLSGQQSVVINLKALCSSLGIPYDTVEYRVTEEIPKEVETFNGTENGQEVLYSVRQFTPDEEMTGDKDKTSVEVQNSVTQYNSVIYKRIGGREAAQRPRKKLALVLRDGNKHNRQNGVRWIATGKTFDRVTAQTGITGEDGRLYVDSFEGWVNTSDDNMTYFVRIFFDHNVECNLNRSDNAQLLEISEDIMNTDPSWGYPIGYETYGEPESYVSQAALEGTDQWKRKQDTIVNTTEAVTEKKIEVSKIVKSLHTQMTDEDRTTEFTFKVRQFVNDVYMDSPGISYVIYDEDGTVLREDKTDSLGSFTLRHGQKAELTLPLYCYWEVIEADAGTYRLLVDDNGNIVYDANNNYMLDDEDGLAPSRTAAEKYNARQSASGFIFNTDLDIVAGVSMGAPVILRRGKWDNYAKSYNFILQKTGWNDMDDNSTQQSKAYKDDAVYSENNAELRINNVYGRTIYADLKLTQPIWTTETSGEIYDKVCEFWQGDVEIPEYIYYREPTDLHQLYRHPVVGIASNAFKGTTTLNSVKIPDSVKKIGNSAFADCTSLTVCDFEQDSSTRQSELRAIGAYAFKNSAVKTFHIPEGTVEIGNSALFSSPKTGFDIYLPSTLTHAGSKILPSIDQRGNNPPYSVLEMNSGVNNANGILNTRYYSVTKAAGDLFSDQFFTRPNVLIMNGIKEIKREAFSDQAEKMRYTSIMVFPEDSDLIVRDFAMVRTSFNKRPFMLIWRSPNVGNEDNQGPILGSTDIYINNNQAIPDQGYYNSQNTTLVFTNISRNDTEKIEMIKRRFELAQDNEGWYFDGKNYINNVQSAYVIGGPDKRITVLFKEDVQAASATELLNNAGVKKYDINGRVADILASYSGRRSSPMNSVPVHTNSADYKFDPQGLWLLRKRTDNN